MTLDNLREFSDLRDEVADLIFALPGQIDAREHREPHPDFARFKDRRVSRDDAVLLKHPDPPQAWRRGKADLRSEFVVGDTASPLQHAENLSVDRVECHRNPMLIIIEAR